MLKKLLAAVICICVLTTAIIPASASAAWQTKTGHNALMFDINGSQTVNSTDAREMMVAIVEGSAMSMRKTAMVDYDADGACTTTDVRYCLESLVGIDSVHRSIPFEARNINTGFGLYMGEKARVFSTEEAWNDFYYFEGTPKWTYGDDFTTLGNFEIDFSTQSVIVAHYGYEEEYVAAVTTDENTVYISMVRMIDPEYAVLDQYSFVLLTVNTADILGKEVKITRYDDFTAKSIEITETSAFNMTDDRALFKTGCACDHTKPHVFESVTDCNAYLDMHQNPDGTAPLTAEAFENYNEAFFADNVLIGFYHAVTDNITITPQYIQLSEDYLFVKIDYTYTAPAEAYDVFDEQMIFVTLPREHYHQQIIDVVSYTKRYQAQN